MTLMDLDECIRCGEAPGVDENGYCCYCHWTVKLEVEIGLRELYEYLSAWARFADWCAGHGATGATRE